MTGRQADKRADLSRSVLGLAEAPSTGGSGGGGIVRSALTLHREGLAEKVARLEGEREAEGARGDRLLRVDPSLIDDPLPPDRDPRAFADVAFESLRDSIGRHGQHTPVVVRAAPGVPGRYEVAAGRRRLRACGDLGIPVLARVLALDDEAMLALQYRENSERADVSLFERSRWFVSLADTRGLSTTAIAGLVGLSQPTIVDYLRLGRLPMPLLELLGDPRELSLADGRRLGEALKVEGGLGRMVATLEASRGEAGGTRVRVEHALRAARGEAEPARQEVVRATRGREIRDNDGRRIGFLSRSGRQWVCRFDPHLDAAAVDWLMGQIPSLLARRRAKAGD